MTTAAKEMTPEDTIAGNCVKIDEGHSVGL